VHGGPKTIVDQSGMAASRIAPVHFSRRSKANTVLAKWGGEARNQGGRTMGVWGDSRLKELLNCLFRVAANCSLMLSGAVVCRLCCCTAASTFESCSSTDSASNLPRRFHSILRDKNGRDIGKSQSKWTAHKMETPPRNSFTSASSVALLLAPRSS
jgi:hypothetical protein